MSQASEKRQTPRIRPFVASCNVVDKERRVSGYLTELSPDGARIQCSEEPPPPGSPVVLEVRLGRRMVRSRLAASVKWVGEVAGGGWVFGLTFGEIGSEERDLLEAVVEEFRRRAAELA